MRSTHTIEGVETHVSVRGEGPAMLFLHGNPTSGELWDDVIRRLPRVRAVVPDLPGFGRSHPYGLFDCKLPTLVRWVDGVLRAALGRDEPVHVVVHDIGGPYGLSWAVRNPERVASVTAIDTLYFSRYEWHFWGKVWRIPGLGELSTRLMGRHLFRREMKRGSRRLDEEWIDRVWSRITPATKAMVLRFYRTTDPENFRGWEDELRGLLARVPSQALWGVHDPYLPPSWAETLGAQEVIYFEDCGHWLPAEDPAGVAARLHWILGETGAAADRV